MHNIAEGTKVDMAIAPQTGSTSYNGQYFRMDKYAKGMFVAHAAGVLTGTDMVLKVYEATDAAGTSAQQLGADVTITQGTKITSCTVAFSSIDVDDTIIITPYTFDGQGLLSAGTALTFTAKAGETLASRYFDQATSDTATGTSFAACVNNATYGIPGVLATDGGAGTVTLTMDEPGDGVFTIVESDTTKSLVTDTGQQAHFEVAVQDLDRDDDFTHIQARLSGVAAGDEVGCVLIRALPSYAPVGQVSAAFDDGK